jgi:hypothetical protein
MPNFFRILSVSADAKTRKGEQFGYLTGIIYMAPSDQSGVINVCPHASAGCREACLFSAGMGKFPNVIKARTAKTVWFAEDRAGFIKQLVSEIKILKAMAEAKGLKAAIRFNGTSDLPWENWGIIEQFSDVNFYDYTKDAARMLRKRPANYHLTFSRSEENQDKVLKVVEAGENVAVVFDKLPQTYLGREVINGDTSDLRFLDKKGVIVGLTPKGRAKKDASGFVVRECSH